MVAAAAAARTCRRKSKVVLQDVDLLKAQRLKLKRCVEFDIVSVYSWRSALFEISKVKAKGQSATSEMSKVEVKGKPALSLKNCRRSFSRGNGVSRGNGFSRGS